VSVVNLNNGRHKPVKFSGKKKEYLKKLMSLKQRERTQISETYVEEYINVRRFANLDLT
jgi:hypothetical protein